MIGLGICGVYIYIMTIKNEIMSFAATWMEQETLILSEFRQRKTNSI